MAAFGISFPKLTFCRSTTSKVDPNSIPMTTTTPSPTTGARTLSLSIKNIPSQPIQYDVSTSTVKKKTTSLTTILAIDGETKQLPKKLSVFNELQLDDEADTRPQDENSSAITVPSSLSSLRIIDHRPDIRFLTDIDSKHRLHDFKDENKQAIEEQRSNHTFTPPTSSLSNNSSSNDLHFTSSSFSVDTPQLKHAIEKFLVEDDNPFYQIAEEFSSGCSLSHQDDNENNRHSNVSTSDLKQQQDERIDRTGLCEMHEKNVNEEITTRSPLVSNNIRWYVSELRINRPLVYRTQWTERQARANNRKLSHSVNDLKQIYNIINRSQDDKDRIIDNIAYTNLSSKNVDIREQQRYHRSDDNILLHSQLSCKNDDLNLFDHVEKDPHQSPLADRRTLNRSLGRDDTLIRNESVKKKLFDILNDDELENACLEDMSQEFEQMSITRHFHDFPVVNSFPPSSSSSDDALYYSPPNEFQFPLLAPPPLSLSYNENLSTSIYKTTERYFGRSRLITTSLDKIPMHTNVHVYDHPSSPCLLRPSYEHIRPSWYTSPSPSWHTDDQLPVALSSKRHSLKNVAHLNGIDTIEPNRSLRTKDTEYDIKENEYAQKYNYCHQKERQHVSYSLLDTSTPLVDDASTIRPIIQDKSSNLLMFI